MLEVLLRNSADHGTTAEALEICRARDHAGRTAPHVIAAGIVLTVALDRCDVWSISPVGVGNGLTSCMSRQVHILSYGPCHLPLYDIAR